MWFSTLRMKKFEEEKAAGNPTPHAAIDDMKGVYRCCAYKWCKTRARDQWSLVCSTAPDLARKYKELPNILRKMMGKKLKFAWRDPGVSEQPQTCTLPPAFEEVMAETIATHLKVL